MRQTKESNCKVPKSQSPVDTGEIDKYLPASYIRQQLGLSRPSFERLVASGVIGNSIRHGNGKNAMRYFKHRDVASYLDRLEQSDTHRECEIRAKATRILRG